MAKPKEHLEDDLTGGTTLSIRVCARTYTELCKQARKRGMKPSPLGRFLIEEALGLTKTS